MKDKLRIVMIASECVPYVKTGGLADVVGALPKALHALGHEVKIIIPKYTKINTERYALQRCHENMGVWMGGNIQEWCSVDQTNLAAGLDVYFIESWKYFGREGLYNDEDNVAFRDNGLRFSFFSRAALQLCIDKDFAPDIIHAHDWQAAPAIAYLKTWHWNTPGLSNTAGVLTIHNIQYQGVFGREDYEYTGLGWEHFTFDKFEYHGNINFLKGGIYFADFVNTVSPTYSYETRVSELGHGLQSSLNHKGNTYLGILNGVDYQEWNPETDQFIPANFSVQDLSGKKVCKTKIQELFHLNVDPDTPIIGVVSRLADQKGLDLLYEAIHLAMHHLQYKMQFVLLGSGDKILEAKYKALPSQYPGQVGTYIGYDNAKAHWIEAGSDFFIMPSNFEPCGLNQMYSLRYGTLPIVRNTGGLADTIEQYSEWSKEKGTGFKYWENNSVAIANTIAWAVSTYHDRPEHIDKMIQRAMSQRFDWENSARTYLEMYRKALH